MADQENQNIEALEAESNEESMAYWCHQCNKEVSLEPHEEESERVCSECRHGFVEAVATAQRAQHDRMANNARPRRQRHARGERTADSSDYRLGRRVWYYSGEAGSRAGNEIDRLQGDEEEDVDGDNVLIIELDTSDSSEEDDEEEDEDEEEGENDAWEEVHTGDAREDQGEQRGNEEPDLNSDEDEEEEQNDAWEEVDAGDDREGQGEQRCNEEPDLNSEENIAASNDAGERRPTSRRRDVLRLRWNSQSGGAVLETSRGSLDWNEINQGLEDNTIELRVSLPEEDTYVGNPEDYVDEAGNEILLQNFAENDDTHRGAPPAAESVIEGLPAVVICQDEIESGAALCVICKDVIPLGESGKKLPCKHLYHGDCLIHWLNIRNSCPLCRYQLPTDDADYEDQKK